MSEPAYYVSVDATASTDGSAVAPAFSDGWILKGDILQSIVVEPLTDPSTGAVRAFFGATEVPGGNFTYIWKTAATDPGRRPGWYGRFVAPRNLKVFLSCSGRNATATTHRATACVITGNPALRFF